MKKIYLILLMIISLFTLNVHASTRTFDRTEENLLVPDYITVTNKNRSDVLITPAVDATEKIYDFGDLFTDKEEKELYGLVLGFTDKTNLDLAIVTISYNNKHSASKYADDFYDYNAFGLEDDQRGLLFIIDMDTRNIYVSTTGEAINIYTDERINNIMDNVFGYMSRGEYYTGTTKFINLALSYAKLNSTDDSKYVINDDGELVKDRSEIFGAFVFAIIVTIIALVIMVKMNTLVFKATSSKAYLKKETMNVKKTKDVFLGSSVSKVRIDNDSSSGGHHGGGSSIHVGGSGVSHGGGGHRF